MPSELVIKSSKAIAARSLTISFAESATSGRLCYEYSLVPDSGKILRGGLVCYDVCIKEDILGIPHELIEQFTPESEEVTRELAERLHRFMDADIAVGVTGLTTPGGSESPIKPVGTMFICILYEGVSTATRQIFSGSPEEIVMQTVDRVAGLLLQLLSRS